MFKKGFISFLVNEKIIYNENNRYKYNKIHDYRTLPSLMEFPHLGQINHSSLSIIKPHLLHFFGPSIENTLKIVMTTNIIIRKNIIEPMMFLK